MGMHLSGRKKVTVRGAAAMVMAVEAIGEAGVARGKEMEKGVVVEAATVMVEMATGVGVWRACRSDTSYSSCYPARPTSDKIVHHRLSWESTKVEGRPELGGRQDRRR